MDNPISQTLLAGAEWLEKHTWCQDEYGYRDGEPWIPGEEHEPDKCCLIGALAAATDLNLADEALFHAIGAVALHLGLVEEANVFNEDVPLTYYERFEALVPAVSEWNDDAGRTREDVVRALRASAQHIPD